MKQRKELSAHAVLNRDLSQKHIISLKRQIELAKEGVSTLPLSQKKTRERITHELRGSIERNGKSLDNKDYRVKDTLVSTILNGNRGANQNHILATEGSILVNDHVMPASSRAAVGTIAANSGTFDQAIIAGMSNK